MKFHEYQSKGSGDMERTQNCYRLTEGLRDWRIDGLTEEGHSFNLLSASGWGNNTERNICVKFHENQSKGSGDMEQTGKCYRPTD